MFLELNINGYLVLLFKIFFICFIIVLDLFLFSSFIFLVVRKNRCVLECFFVGIVFIVEFSKGCRYVLIFVGFRLVIFGFVLLGEGLSLCMFVIFNGGEVMLIL